MYFLLHYIFPESFTLQIQDMLNSMKYRLIIEQIKPTDIKNMNKICSVSQYLNDTCIFNLSVIIIKYYLYKDIKIKQKQSQSWCVNNTFVLQVHFAILN